MTESNIAGGRRAGIVLAVIAWAGNCCAALDAIQRCEPGSASNLSIALVGSATSLVLKPMWVDSAASADTSTTGNSRTTANTHIYIRNDGTVPVSIWCAAVTAADATARTSLAEIELGRDQHSQGEACQQLSSSLSPGEIGDMTLAIFGRPDQLPLTGSLTIRAAADVVKKASDDEKKKGIVPVGTCRVNSKPVTQNVVVTAIDSDLHAGELLLYTGIPAFTFFLVCTGRFRRCLGQPMGPSQWSFSGSAATNLTIVGGLLSTALASTAIPEYPHYLSRSGYTVLGLLFALLAALAPVVYNFCCEPTGPNAQNSQLLDFQGTMLLFLIADAYYVGGFGPNGMPFFVVRRICISTNRCEIFDLGRRRCRSRYDGVSGGLLLSDRAILCGETSSQTSGDSVKGRSDCRGDRGNSSEVVCSLEI